MKKIFVQLQLFCLLFGLYIADIPANTHFLAEYNYIPYSLDLQSEYRISSMELLLQGGWELSRIYSLDVAVDMKYSSLESLALYGSSIQLAGQINNRFMLQNWLGLELGIGGSWNRSSYNYLNSGWYSGNMGGLSITAKAVLWPQNILNLELVNALDILFFANPRSADLITYPVNKTGLKLIFTPPESLLSFYGDLSYIYWNYRNHFLSETVHLVAAGIGVTLKLKESEPRKMEPPTTITPLSKEPPSFIETVLEEKVPEPDNNKSAYQIGDEIEMSGFVFDSGNVEIISQNDLQLDEIAAVLTDNRTLRISLTSSVSFIGNPVLEVEIAQRRSLLIKEKLMEKGVEGDQVKINAMAVIDNSCATTDSTITARLLQKQEQKTALQDENRDGLPSFNRQQLEQLLSGRAGVTVKIGGLMFDEDNSRIISKTDSLLKEIASILMDNRPLTISLVSSIPFSGDPIRETESAIQRSKLVKQKMVEQGADGSQIKIKSIALFDSAGGETVTIITIEENKNSDL